MEEKMTAETALLVLAVGARVSKDEVIAEKASSLEAIIRTELTELRAERDKIKVSRDLHEQLLKEALDEASPYFQCGGRYAHWVSLGQCVFKGIGVLAEKYEAAQAELKAANETIEQERSLRSDVIAQRDAFREQNKLLKQAREEKVTGEADGWMWYHDKEGYFDWVHKSQEQALNNGTPLIDGWRVVPVKIVKVEEAQSNSSETMRDEN